MVIVLSLVVAGAVLIRRGDGEEGVRSPVVDRRAGSVLVEDGVNGVDIVRSPASFHVVYRSESGRHDVVVTTDRLWVRRPWESRLESWTGAPPGRRRLSEEVAAFAARRSAGDDEAPLVLALSPYVPAGDVRLAPALAAALEAGVVERREVRRVAGRLCQVYRSGTFFSDTEFTPATADEWADSCVDEAGIVVEEVLFSHGDPILRRVAVKVEEDPALDGSLFVTGEPTVGVRDGGGFVREADAGTRPEGEFFELPSAPEGFRLRGRYTVVPPQPENFSDPSREFHRVAGTVDVFERGIDIVAVDQGATLGGKDPFVADPANPTVDVGPALGEAEVLTGPRGNEVRVDRGGGRYLRVYGTLPPGDLASFAGRLEPVEGTGLRYLG